MHKLRDYADVPYKPNNYNANHLLGLGHYLGMCVTSHQLNWLLLLWTDSAGAHFHNLRHLR